MPLCRNADRGFWLKERLPSLIFHETTASVISNYESMVVPGLLQTEAYARALIDQQSLGIPDRVAAVRIRLRRQRILHDEFRPPKCTFYVHEQALRLPVGGNRVMNEQMLQMVLLADRPNIVIRVVPTSAGLGAPLAVRTCSSSTTSTSRWSTRRTV